MITRRKFLTATGAAGAALVTLPLSAKLLSDKVTEKFGVYTGHDCMLTHAYAGRPTSVLIVVPTFHESQAIQQGLSAPPHRHIKVVAVGGALAGYGADIILTDDACKDFAARQGFPYEDWFNQVVRTRLMPGGTIIDTVAREEKFDFDTQTGFAMSFYDWDQEIVNRQAFRIRKPSISYDDRLQAKIALYRWWLQERGVTLA